MKTTVLAVIFSLGIAAPLFAGGTNILSDEKSRVSYAIGMMLGHNWQQQGLEVDPDIAAHAIKDVQTGGTTLLSQAEMQETLTEFQKTFKIKQQKMQAEKAEKSKAEGEAFLSKNKGNAGVITLPDGLQYTVLAEGTGAMPAASDVVSVNYRGTLLDGTEFDSSYKRGQPAQFPVNGVIKGWTEALQLMKTGSKWKLFIPSDLAYGENGQRGIPPNSVLVFEVELLSVQAPPPPAAPPQPLTSDIIKVPSAEEMKKGAKIETLKPEDVQKLQQAQPQSK
ncbi:MAG TPA: FKBP-type peptidyl-prolyl cis-trans isomerase [Verrucomicrobiae bacterium]|nr:FKBP-type peptidyl-prolyl cis-trans isomerase [Verrucomicrobiae bacterium]